jgi:hypothetical protein
VERDHVRRLENSVVLEIAETKDLGIFQKEVVGIVEHHRIIHYFIVSCRIKLNQLAVYCDVSHVYNEYFVVFQLIISLWDEQNWGVELHIKHYRRMSLLLVLLFSQSKHNFTAFIDILKQLFRSDPLIVVN